MTSLKEIFSSLLDSTKERLKNPILGAFVFSWLAINWRIVLILLFSSKTVEQRISYIEENFINIWFYFWIPLFISIFYIAILPYLMLGLDLLLKKVILNRRTVSKDHRIKELQNRQDIAKEQSKLEKIVAGTAELSEVNRENENLKKQLESLRKQIESKNATIEDQLNQINELSEQNIERLSPEKEAPIQEAQVEVPLKKPTPKPKNTSNKKPGKQKTKSTGYNIITDLNLNPRGNSSLRDFYNQFEARNNFDNNILCLYYLKEILKIDNVTVDHVFTCYRDLNLKIPNLRQSLWDTKNRKGWIDTSDTNDLRITVHGDNYVRHDIPRKVAE